MPARSGLDPTPLDRLRETLLTRRNALWLRRTAAAALLLLALVLALGQRHTDVDIATGVTRTGEHLASATTFHDSTTVTLPRSA
ncbi:hypothetical protein [Saccharopolyspora flava]|uniref:Uncharacterized protein n=1 Tax=Saccharopolyspora flava TaxID=95161 RepID=A0A1I6QSB9_9PSEU|nr:hypothetical protein [Saccharopolyspora flava]SFS55355.1 hypothetical protein SAMN05660874_01795 [Saccharopolyspora flava]